MCQSAGTMCEIIDAMHIWISIIYKQFEGCKVSLNLLVQTCNLFL
jgi:hypothetical protein